MHSTLLFPFFSIMSPGLIVGFLLTISCVRFFAALLAFFISASKATVYRSEAKKKVEADFKEGLLSCPLSHVVGHTDFFPLLFKFICLMCRVI